jgi:hypothetical protein
VEKAFCPHGVLERASKPLCTHLNISGPSNRICEENVSAVVRMETDEGHKKDAAHTLMYRTMAKIRIGRASVAKLRLRYGWEEDEVYDC